MQIVAEEDLLEFQKHQLSLSHHLKNPSLNKKPESLEERRVAIYRDLFFNNIKGLVQSGYPVIYKIIGEEAFDQLVRSFYSSCACQTPYFTEIAGEFLEYLQSEPEVDIFKNLIAQYPFLVELAHYEWVELAIAITQDEAQSQNVSIHSGGNYLKGIPALEEQLVVLEYNYPVHQISKDFLPTESTVSHYIVYRDQSAFKVEFVLVTAIVAKLVEMIQQNPYHKASELLHMLAQQSAIVDQQQVSRFVEQGEDLLHFLKQKNIILGTKIRSVDHKS